MISSEDMFVVIVFNQIILVNLSMITIIASFPFNFGGGPTMYMLISCHGSCGISIECSSSAFF